MLNEDLEKYFRDITKFETNLSQGPLAQLLFSEPLQRLKGISFIPSICLPYEHSIVFNRYEHSLGVAFLANLVAEHLGVDSNVKVSLIAASLLHDVGHTPLSHVAEQFLVETRRRYHHSQSLLISHSIKISIDDRTSEIIDLATHFLQKKSDFMLFPLIRGLFSCDNLDGIMRSCLTLRRCSR